MSYYAHTANDADGKPAGVEHWQLLKDHLRGVAHLAREFARPLDLQAEAELAGLLHDVGKYRGEFQQYLRNERTAGSDTHHAIYGAAHAFTSEMLPQAFAIAGHHAGLPEQHDLHNTVHGGKYDAVEPPATRLP
ncbi:MAG: CRISPR-associated endonuclease Cas3'' [Verrucomicrobiota bacterium]|nr:CRISPR-associated endonuclease Cas3'' [Verrucomicrobiota bacterium]